MIDSQNIFSKNNFETEFRKFIFDILVILKLDKFFTETFASAKNTENLFFEAVKD